MSLKVNIGALWLHEVKEKAFATVIFHRYPAIMNNLSEPGSDDELPYTQNVEAVFQSDDTEPVDNTADVHSSISKRQPCVSSPPQNNQEEEYHPRMPTQIPDNGFVELVQTMQDGFHQVKDLLIDLLHMHRGTSNAAALPSELSSSTSDTASTPSRHKHFKSQDTWRIKVSCSCQYVLCIMCIFIPHSKKQGRFMKLC